MDKLPHIIETTQSVIDGIRDEFENRRAQTVKQEQEPVGYEKYNAIRQGHEIVASDTYFNARPQIDGVDRRNVFRAGFNFGYAANPPADAQQHTGLIYTCSCDAYKQEIERLKAENALLYGQMLSLQTRNFEQQAQLSAIKVAVEESNSSEYGDSIEIHRNKWQALFNAMQDGGDILYLNKSAIKPTI